MGKTIAQQLNIKKFPFNIKDENGNIIYYENSNAYWSKLEYKDGKEIYFESSTGFWRKSEYKDGKQVYYEDSRGVIKYNIPKERPCVGEKVTIDGIEYELK